MALRLNTSLIILLISLSLSCCLCSGRWMERSENAADVHPAVHTEVMKEGMENRKLVEENVSILDYERPGPNTKHDQGKGKPSGGGN